MMRIDYYSETDKDYVKALTPCATLAELRLTLGNFRRVAADAVAVAEGMTDADFKEFRRGLKSERSGKFAGEAWADRYNAVLMPEVLFRVSDVAFQFKVPWGLAFIRLKDAGRIVESDGHAKWIDPHPRESASTEGVSP